MFDFLVAIIALLLAIGSIAASYKLKAEVRRLNVGVDSAIDTAARSRVASDAAAATLSRDQDALWRMRSDVDTARKDIGEVRQEIQAVRTDIDGVHRDFENLRQSIGDGRKDVEAVRRVLIGLRNDLEDLRKEVEAAETQAEPSPLPIPQESRTDTLQELREQLRAEQQTGEPDDEDR
jgi:septal ring factor EnvC (AmiA/AmiB activator)